MRALISLFYRGDEDEDGVLSYAELVGFRNASRLHVGGLASLVDGSPLSRVDWLQKFEDQFANCFYSGCYPNLPCHPSTMNPTANPSTGQEH